MKGGVYIESWDPSLGGTTRGDPSAGHVTRADVFPWRVVARYHGWLAPIPQAVEMTCMAKWYNDALVGCENNACGNTVVLEAQRLGCRQLTRGMTDPQRRSESLGWTTGESSKQRAIHSMRAVVMSHWIVCPCERTRYEIGAFEFAMDEKGNETIVTAANRHDDLAMSFSITCAMLMGEMEVYQQLSGLKKPKEGRKVLGEFVPMDVDDDGDDSRSVDDWRPDGARLMPTVSGGYGRYED